MEEDVVTKEKEKEALKKTETKHALLRAVEVTGTKTEQAPKQQPSLISILETSVRAETKPSKQPSLMRIDVATVKVVSTTPKKEEAISIKQGAVGLEWKPTEKKEMISISEGTLTVIPVTPSAIVKKETFRVRYNSAPEVTVASKVELKVEPLRLEKKARLAKEKVSLEPVRITLPEPRIVELVKIRTREREVEDEEIRALEEIPNFYDIFMKGGFGGLTTVDRPACIILPRSYPESCVDSVALMCREFYRFKKGGKPSPRILSTGSREEVEKSLEAGERIFIIDDSRCELIKLSTIKRVEDINWEHLYNRLRELFSQDYGFVIFHLDEKWVDDFRSKLEKVAHMIPKLFIVKFNGLSPKVKDEIARMCWGFISSRGKTFDEVFCNAEKAFYDKLEEIGKDEWLMHCTKPHRLGPESPEHRLLKALVVKIVAKEKRIDRQLIPEKISTEYESPITKGLIVDVFVNDTKEFIEVETLYGTGFNPVDKIDHETLQRYVTHHETLQRYVTHKINVKVVMLPMPFLTYLKSLANLRRIYKKEYGINVEFYTVDIENERLIPLKDIIERLKELKKQIEDMSEAKEIEYKQLKEMGLTEEEIKGILSPPWKEDFDS
jgi:hypothetical protein